MKKTLITLMALVGMASAATTIDAQFTTVPTTEDNFWADDYVLTFTLAKEYDIATSGAIVGAYWGTQKNNNGDDPGLSANAVYLTASSNGALTLNVGDGKLSSILGNTGTLDNTITFTSARGTTFTGVTIEKGVTYTLTVVGANQSMTPTLTWDGGTATAAAYNGNMNGNTATMNYGVNPGITIEVPPTPETPAIPEPATATLSLLALAGLAARRRRK